MPKKKADAEPTAKKDTPKTSAERVKASSDRNAAEAKAQDEATNRERAAAQALAEASGAALINQATKVKPDPEGDIDQRMAALLKDHQEMGVRPK